MQAEGDVALIFASLETFKEWQFEPATRGGEPIESATNMEVRYRTKG